MLHLPSLWHQNSFLLFAMKLLPESCLCWICEVNDFLTASGIFVALALRFDVSRGRPNRYFNSAFAGYTAGLVLTIFVMNWFQAAQVNFVMHLYSFPSHSNSVSIFERTLFWGTFCSLLVQPALLYIVPGVIGFVAAHCLWNGEVKEVKENNDAFTL